MIASCATGRKAATTAHRRLYHRTPLELVDGFAVMAAKGARQIPAKGLARKSMNVPITKVAGLIHVPHACWRVAFGRPWMVAFTLALTTLAARSVFP